jgi:hypothetical protein
LEGIHYVIENGSKRLLPPKIVTSTPSYTLTVTPFPREDQPLDFNGSIGTGTFTLNPPQESKARVGDPIIFSITANDFEPNSVLIPPNINCLPGFPGFFKNDPSTTLIQKNPADHSTTFQFKISAENTLPQEIPPLIWSVFNPIQNSYKSFKLGPMPIALTDSLPVYPLETLVIQGVSHHQDLKPLAPLNPKEPLWLDRSYLPFHLSLLALFFALIFLRKPLRKLSLLRQFNPLNRAKKALQQQESSLEVAQTISALLTQALKKNKLTEKDEKAQAVYEFLEVLDRFRFAQGVSLTKETIYKTGMKLYRSLPLLLLFIPTLAHAEIEWHLEKGALSTSWIEREKEWNLALNTLLTAPPSEKNDLTLAFLFAEFQNEPHALFYLQRAAANAPWNQELHNQIETLENQMGVTGVPASKLARYSAAFKGGTTVFLLMGLYLFFKRQRKLSYLFLAASSLLIAFFCTLPLLIPQSALILTPSFIYQDATLQTKANSIPLIPGDSVKIVGIEEDTFKIYSYPLETYGYILQTTLRPID